MTPLQETTANHISALGLQYNVLGSGSPSSQICIIAEFPGETECQLKQPLVGNSGRYLWTELSKIGVKREQCYITNVIKRRTTSEDNKNDKTPVPAEELRKWNAVLMQELSELANVKYIILLGNVALKSVTGHTGIKKWRGSVISFTQEMGFKRDGQILISYNPAYILRDPSVEVHFKIDMRRLSRVLNGTYKPYVIHANINPTKRQAVDFLRQLRADKLPTATDIETLGNETACIGFANNNHEGMCINFRDEQNTSRFDVHDEMAIRMEIQDLFNDKQVQIIGQNLNFDAYWLWYKDRLRLVPWYDTLLAHHTLYPSLPHSLAFLTTAYTEHPYYKDEKDDWRAVGSMSGYWEYNVKDCCITRKACEETHKELRSQKLEDFFFSHVMRLQPHLVTMTVNGIRIDQSLRTTIASQLTTQLDALERDFILKAQTATSDPNLEINPRSAIQLRELFFHRLKFVGRGFSTDEDNRNRIKQHPNTSPVSKEMLISLDKYKDRHKFYSTYVDTTIDEDGRSRSEWKQWGTTKAPGRLSSSSVMWGSGSNFQNQPEEAKAMYTAPPGYGFVYFDLSQAEARYVAVAWNVKALIENFEKARLEPDKYDVHRLNAARIFQKNYDEIPKKDFDESGEPTLRYQGKRAVHGFNYTLQPDAAAIKFGISLAQATHAHRLYHTAFPEISPEWTNIRKRVERDRVLYNAYGRRWILLSRIDDDKALESIIAFEPQSSVGDKVCKVIYQSHEDPEWPRSRHGLEAAITLNVHDALIALARLEDMHTVAGVLKRHASEPLIVRNQELVIPCEFAFSKADDTGTHRWSTLEKVKV